MSEFPSSPEVNCHEGGYSLVSLMMGALLSAIILGSAFSLFADSTRRTVHSTQLNTVGQQAHAVLTTMVFDLRMAGSGMPLGQSDFEGTDFDPPLREATLSILPSSNPSSITLRLNERGKQATVMSDYSPSSDPLLVLSDTSDLDVGDTIYLSNMAVGGNGGLRGVIASVIGSSISLAAPIITSPQTTFATGSTVERVSTITFASPTDWSGITRDNESGATLVAPHSSFTIDYLDTNGAPLPLPLTEESIQSSLSALRITVTVRSGTPVQGRGALSASASQRVTLRNLLLARSG